MGNNCCKSSFSESHDNIQVISTSKPQLIYPPALFKWTNEIESTLKDILCEEHKFPHDLFSLFLSFIDKTYTVYKNDNKYPIYIAKDTLDYSINLNTVQRIILPDPENFNNLPSITIAIHGASGVGKTSIITRFVADTFGQVYDPIVCDDDAFGRSININNINCNIDIDSDINQEKQELELLDNCNKNINYKNNKIAYENEINIWLKIREMQWSIILHRDTEAYKGWYAKDHGFKLDHSHIHLIVFSMVDRRSFQKIEETYLKIIEIATNLNVPNDALKIILVGNKSDLNDSKDDPTYYGIPVSLNEIIEYAKMKQMPFVQTSALDNGNIQLLFKIATRYALIQSHIDSSND